MTTAFEADRQDREPLDRLPLVADVQRFGLLSAATVVRRYAAVVDRALGTGPSPAEAPRRADVDMDWMVGLGPRVAEAALRLLDEATALAVDATTTRSPGAPEHLQLPAAVPGASSQVSLWLHNPTAATVAARVHVTCLVSGDGVVLPSESLTCQPSDDVQLAPTAVSEVLLRVSVPAGQPAGSYHGLLVASVAPEPMRLALQVIDGGSEAPVHGGGSAPLVLGDGSKAP